MVGVSAAEAVAVGNMGSFVKILDWGSPGSHFSLFLFAQPTKRLLPNIMCK